MGSRTKIAKLLVLLVGSALLLAPAAARTRFVDLRESPPDVVLTGAYKVAGGGDVNGDGTPDVLVAKGRRGYEPTSGVTYVVFGGQNMESMDLANMGDNGFAIHGAKPDDGASQAASAGDVNGDGRDDIIIGAPEADNNGRLTSGSAYVVFGKADILPVHLAQFDANAQGPLGFRIDGPSSLAIAGEMVDGIGDMNKDGLDDVIVAAPFAGASYVVFGKQDFLPVDLRLFQMGLHGDSGFLIRTPKPNLNFLYSVAGVGDVNYDKTPDVVVGVFKNDRKLRGGYVVFGKKSGSPVDVLRLGSKGFRISGYGANPIVGIGDVNRDGLDDLAYYYGGLTFVVFGKRSSSTVWLPRIGNKGFAIRSGDTSAGRSLSGIGDLNDDNRPDLLVSVDEADFHGRDGAGSVYVIYGKASTSPVRLWDLGRQGYRIDGAHANYSVGARVSSTPDISGDGTWEILIGAPGDTFPETSAYIVFPRL